jgi:hypothetical protein
MLQPLTENLLIQWQRILARQGRYGIRRFKIFFVPNNNFRTPEPIVIETWYLYHAA